MVTRRSLPVSVTLLLLWASAWPASGATEVTVKVGETVEVALPRQPQIISIEDPSIATMRVTADGRALVRGRRPGKTRIIGRDYSEVPFIIPVTVVPK